MSTAKLIRYQQQSLNAPIEIESVTTFELPTIKCNEWQHNVIAEKIKFQINNRLPTIVGKEHYRFATYLILPSKMNLL